MKRVLILVAAIVAIPALALWAGGKGEAKPAAVHYSAWVGEGTWLTNIMDLTFQDPVAKEITRRTGVTLDLTAARTDNPSEELNIMLASGDLPDIVAISGSITTKLIDGKYVIPVDDLINKYAPNLKAKLGHVFNYWKYDDGKIYRMRGWVWNDPRYSLSFDVNTLYMRYDVLKELGYPKLSRDKPLNSVITIDEYMNLLNQVRQKRPEMTPVLMDGWFATYVMLASTGASAIGDAFWENGQARYTWDSKDVSWAIQWLNKLYLDGYVEKGFATLSKEQAQALTSSGKVFSTLGRFEGLPEARSSLSAEQDEKRLAMFYLVKDSTVKHVGINGYYIDGDDSVFITTKAKDPVGIMRFFDWCNTEEGLVLLNAGVEGLSWNMVNGKRVPTDKAMKAYYLWDSTLLKELGLGTWNGFLPSLAGMDKNGNAYDINQQATFESNKWGQYDMTDWKFFANPNYAGEKVSFIDSVRQKDAYDANSKISAYLRDRVVKAIAAPSAADSASQWKDTYAMMKADGIDAIDAAKNDNWVKAAKFFNKAPADLLKDVAVIGASN